MFQRPLSPRSSDRRRRLRFEVLEARQVLSASFGPSPDTGPISEFYSSAQSNTLDTTDPGDLSTLRPIGVTPASGSILTESPSEVVVRFNLPFPIFYATTKDIGIRPLNPDGSPGDFLQDFLVPDLTGYLDTDTLVLFLSEPLSPGKYEIVLLGSTSGLLGVDEFGTPSIPLYNWGTDTPICSFTIDPNWTDPPEEPGPPPDPEPVAPKPQVLGDAQNLGPIGPIQVNQSGYLNLAANSGNYQLYKFQLAPDQYWRLGIEVASASLNASITIFDESGRVIRFASQGPLGSSAAPFLYLGLKGGTYYLGISGAGNNGLQAQGYDPVKGVYGSSSSNQLGGSFVVKLAADLATTPTTVLDQRLLFADPLNPRPTGLVVVFSQPMNLSSFMNSIAGSANGEVDLGFRGLELVDGNGKVWRLNPTQYIESNSQFTFLFDKPLPAGTYSLRVSNKYPITDLSGQIPVGPSGPDESRILGSWTVTQKSSPPIPNNLGVVTSNIGDAQTWSGLVKAGGSVTYRFVVPAKGYFSLEGDFSQQAGILSIVGSNFASAPVTITPNENGFYSYRLELEPGTYYLRFNAVGSGPLRFSFNVFNRLTSPDSVFSNGIGQGSALDLRLISPQLLPPASGGSFYSGNGTPAGPNPLPLNPSGPGPATPAPGPIVPTPLDMSLPPSTARTDALILTVGNQLVGSPQPEAERVAVVGPAGLSGGTALAANSLSVLQGINYGQGAEFSGNWYGQSLPIPDGEMPITGDEESTLNEALTDVTRTNPELAAENVASLTPTADALPASWFSLVGQTLLSWLTGQPTATTVPETGAAAETSSTPVTEKLLLTGATRAKKPADANQEESNLAAPLAFSFATVLVFRLHSSLHRRFGRGDKRANAQTAKPWRKSSSC